MDTIKYIGTVSPWVDTLTGSGLTWTTNMSANVSDTVGSVANGYPQLFQRTYDGFDGGQLTVADTATVKALVSKAGIGALIEAQPWRLVTFGDSRCNFTSGGNPAGPDLVGTSGAAYDPTKAPTWVAAYMGDAEYVGNYGVSGATVLGATDGWALTSRTAGKTVADLVTRGADVGHIQYAVNDVNNAAASLTTTGAADTLVASVLSGLKQLAGVLLSQGIRVLWETSYPCQAAGWAAQPANCQYALDQINAQMSAWVTANLVPAGLGAVADSASALKQADGYANASYYLSGTNIHLNAAGARMCGQLVANAARTMLQAKRAPVLCAPVVSRLLTTAPNWVPRMSAATAVANNDQGTGTTNSSGWGVDSSGEPYFEVNWTPTSLTSGFARVRIMVQASLGAATSYFTVAGTETVMGAARVTLDDGAGGAPNAFNLIVRQRMFGTATYYTEWSSVSAAAGTDFSTAQNLRPFTPRAANTNASAAITAPGGIDTGYALYVMVEAARVGVPVRIRIYSPTLRQVA